ncbi:MAG: hypothetical protein GX296_06305 [Bacteroidales bacterium]|jgi:hypothetical protein|nr:hypothetical protein [Bacteroidales bacterium]
MKKLFFILIAVATVFSACEKSEVEDVYNPAEDGIVGNWLSAGTDVSPLLTTYFAVDSITADFKSNNTYAVTSYAKGVPTNYVGTFVQTKSGTGAIWTIKLNQSTPTAVTSDGIFEITKVGEDYTMKYEVVQTEPDIGATPPTASAGFGSSSGGALGQTNVQKFVKR